MSFQTIIYEEDGPIGWIKLNRPDDGNMFTHVTCHEIRDLINDIRRETRTRVIVFTGAGDRFFCIGGRKDGMEETTLYAGTLPTLDMYDSIDRLQKPTIAMVNGYAVGGGNVLQMVCDLTIAKESAVFRQVGPMMGSFDAGYGTWYLEDLVGKKKAKEMWFANPKLSAHEALSLGLINRVVPDDELKDTTREWALQIADRGEPSEKKARWTDKRDSHSPSSDWMMPCSLCYETDHVAADCEYFEEKGPDGRTIWSTATASMVAFMESGSSVNGVKGKNKGKHD